MNFIRQRGKLRDQVQWIQIVFQDPFSSTSNRFTVLDAIKEPLYINKIGSNGDDCKVKNALVLVCLSNTDNFLSKYCGELCGGQRQRVELARAMVMDFLALRYFEWVTYI